MNDENMNDEKLIPVEWELSTVASIAGDLVVRWGMVAAVPDGEDQAGRAKNRLMTPEEIVEHACETADTLWKEFEKRGWMARLPETQPTE